jgi:phospholipase C
MRTKATLSLIAVSLVAAGCSVTPSTGSEAPSSAPAVRTARASSLQVARAHLGDARTRSPIKHVIVVIGENRTFDHLFATYKPRRGERVDNLLSKGIVREDGSPGPNYALSNQYTAVDQSPSGWQTSPGDKTLYAHLPPPTVPGYDATPNFSSIADAQAAENGLASDYYKFLTTGGSGLAKGGVDTRIANYANLGAGVYPITGPNMTDDDYAGSPVHRFYQMWQQLDCNAASATASNPSGCASDLWAWVEQTIGAGSNGASEPENYAGEGSVALGFYNMHAGDLDYTRRLANEYTISDNYHQAVNGGTGPNHVMMMSGQGVWYTDANGNPAVPPADQIENPSPTPGTNNWYTQDGYSGGTYSACADASQPGVAAITSYLGALARPVAPNCEEGKYYLLNNYAPGYFGDGTLDKATFVIPPAPLRTVGDTLTGADVSWGYFGDQFDNYVADNNLYDTLNNQYCDICNAFQYSSLIMTDAAARAEHLKDTKDLYAAIAAGTLPAVSFVKPSGLVDGHPASSKWDLFEGFSKKIIDLVKSKPELWDDTAIFVTADEGGGYYDSGYVQPVDFLGDGTRIPLIAVSAHSLGGHVSHEYADHVSILKFIERNWGLPTVTDHSRDNLPNPVTRRADPYVPVNSPAIGDLWDMFDFGR